MASFGILFLMNNKNGLLQSKGYNQIEEDEDAFGTQGRKSRKKAEAQEKVSRVYSGRKAFELFLQAYQYVLWKQCHWLINNRGLPAELETVVRDLWATRYQSLKSMMEYSSDNDSNPTVFSSTSEVESDTTMKEEKSSKETSASKDVLRMVDTLALCYMGMLLLRLPVSVGEVHRWATGEEILFFRAVRFIPREMRNRLPGHYLGALDTRSVLKPDVLQKAVLELILKYNREYGMTFPALNHQLLLFRYIEELAMPLELYPAVTRLSNLLDIRFKFGSSENRHRITSLPEAELISFVIIAAKLSHPFDDRPRHPTTSSEAAALTVDWNVWGRAQQDYEARAKDEGRSGKGDEIKIEEQDVFGMTGDELDNYLDWYERTWISDTGEEPKASKQLLDMFPTGRVDHGMKPKEIRLDTTTEGSQEHGAITHKLKHVQGALRPSRAVSKEDELEIKKPTRRPGSVYKHYRTEDDLPSHARAFYEAAAAVVGLSLTSLVRAVFQTECKLHAWAHRQRKQEAIAAIVETGQMLEDGQNEEAQPENEMEDEEGEEEDREVYSADENQDIYNIR
ncbi:MAG: Pol I core factor CF [Pycnora praestabilis]|nr:MAG: Pol I core factor CF [Pycnora praestabilis]